MKRLIAVLSLLMMFSVLVLPVLADDEPAEPAPYKPANQNQCAEVQSLSEGAVEYNVQNRFFLHEPEMLEILETVEEGIIPEDAVIKHLTMIRQREVVTEGEDPIEITLHTWGPSSRYLLVFFRTTEDEEAEWSVVACAQGNLVEAELPSSGMYALAWTW